MKKREYWVMGLFIFVALGLFALLPLNKSVAVQYSPESQTFSASCLSKSYQSLNEQSCGLVTGKINECQICCGEPSVLNPSSDERNKCSSACLIQLTNWNNRNC